MAYILIFALGILAIVGAGIFLWAGALLAIITMLAISVLPLLFTFWAYLNVKRTYGALPRLLLFGLLTVPLIILGLGWWVFAGLEPQDPAWVLALGTLFMRPWGAPVVLSAVAYSHMSAGAGAIRTLHAFISVYGAIWSYIGVEALAGQVADYVLIGIDRVCPIREDAAQRSVDRAVARISRILGCYPRTTLGRTPTRRLLDF